MSKNLGKIIYDDQCYLCRQLAIFGAQHIDQFEFVPSARQQNQIDKLSVILSSGEIFEGAEAWFYLVERFPYLQNLAWIARKLGFEKSVGKTFELAGEFARRLCWRCRKVRS